MDERPEEIAEDALVSPAGDGETAAGPQQPEPYRPAGPELEAEEARIVEEGPDGKRARRAPLLLAALVVLGAAFALLVLGRGGGEEKGGAVPERAHAELRFVLDRDGEGPEASREVRLRCPGGKPAACRALRKLPRGALRPIPRRRACTMVYGGPDRIVVRGRIGKREVTVDLERTNGCEIERFEQWMGVIRALFPRYRPGAAVR